MFIKVYLCKHEGVTYKTQEYQVCKGEENNIINVYIFILPLQT